MNMGKLGIGKLYFEEGLPGFHNLRFFHLANEESNSSFYVLKSEEEEVEFWAIDPFVFFQDYEFTLSDQAKSLLRIEEDSTIAILNLITLRQDRLVTVNLKAPIVINCDQQKAKQIILNDEKYDIRHPLFQLQAIAASE
ncbi:flagellar assembly protein FliW [Brevibacillus sp. SYSU BS000544]|uniref:flagellar assembly protein FliW n=1 Tax=Brevibacillus sp. SYSU BS000544 TaxID=3416443 RepID=UPI003CE4DD60